jgi:phosphatidylglycerol:prolipoprotein diacylglycerol transferase
MHPVLFKIGGFAVPSYGFMILIGVFFAFLIGRRLTQKEGLSLTDMSDLGLYTLLTALVGARLLLIVTELDVFLKNPRQLLAMLTSAGNFFGGLIAGALFAVFYIRRKKLPLLTVLDIAAPAVAIGHFFGRLGCLLAGCCWGQAAGSCPVAITFHSHEAQTGIPLGVPLLPTQAMEAAFNLLLAGFLLWFYRRKSFSGQPFAIYLVAYGTYRFLSEYFRGDTGRGYLFGDMGHPFQSLSIPQVMSLAAVLIGIGIYRYGRKKTV